MAITTLDGVIAGMRPPEGIFKVGATMKVAGQMHSHLYSPGRPGAAVGPTPGLAGAALTTYAGQIPFVNPGAGNTYLGRLDIAASQPGVFYLCDRLWHNSGLVATQTTAHTINSVTWPARDRDGTTAGEDVLIGIENSVVGGAGTPTMTMSYTNQAGASGRTSIGVVAQTTHHVGTFEAFPLQAGDTGVRSIQTFTSNATRVSGTFHLVAFRILAVVFAPTANMGQAVDALTSGFVRMYDNTVPFIVQLPSAVTATSIAGQLIYTQG